MNDKSKPTLKDKKLRHNEYYGIQPVLDELYQKANKGNSFKKLIPTITSDENILLAFCNIKGNKGSQTAACDNINIKDIERMKQSYFLNEMKRHFQNYQPQKVNQQNLTYVIDVDIKGFFDEVNHAKLMRQIWTLGIRDKQLLVIIRK